MNQKGFGLIEVVIASAIISASLFALAGAAQIAFRVVSESVRKAQAEFLAEESIEVVRILRDTSWSSNIDPLTRNTTYYPLFTAGTATWLLTTTNPGSIDGVFDQTIIFEDVYRDDTSEDIVASTTPDAMIDTGTKEVISRTTWEGGGKRVEMHTYITDMFGS